MGIKILIVQNNMYKKKSSTIAMMFVLLLTSSLMSCDNKNNTSQPSSIHVHDYSDVWNHDETQHWHTCKDSSCGEKKDVSNHTFNWSEKTPAGVHKDKVEKGVCSVCNYESERTIEGSGANIHSWKWNYNDEKHWEETECNQHEPLKRNEELHVWKFIKETEFTHKKVSNCDVKKHVVIEKKGINHTFTNDSDVDCNDCGYVRTLSGKGSFKTINTRTYNGEAQPISSDEYIVDESIKSLCEIQYKLKDSKDNYTTNAPVNAGIYDVRIFCKGNGVYLKGEVAKSEYEINQIEVPVNSFFKLVKKNSDGNYLDLKTYEAIDPKTLAKINLTLRAYGEQYKNQGRYKIIKTNEKFEGLQFDNTNYKPIPTWNEKPQDEVKIIVYADETPVVTGTNQSAKYNVTWIDFAPSPYVIIKKYTVTSGTLQIGDYLICEGINVPLKLIDVELNKGSNGSEPCSGIALAGEIVDIRFAIEGFITKEIVGTKLINTTFTKVDYEVLTFSEGSNTTNSLDVTLEQNKSMYLEFTATVDSAKTFHLNFSSDGGYNASGSFEFYNTSTGEKMTNNLNDVTVNAAGTYTIIIKITKVRQEFNSSYKTVKFSVSIK